MPLEKCCLCETLEERKENHGYFAGGKYHQQTCHKWFVEHWNYVLEGKVVGDDGTPLVITDAELRKILSDIGHPNHQNHNMSFLYDRILMEIALRQQPEI